MRVYRGLPTPASRAPCALTIGNFDGVHRGHQALLGQVRAAADRLGVQAAVMTFEPHPREFFATRAGDLSRAPARIANLRDKLSALGNAGVDRVVVEHFNARFAALSAPDFVKHVLVDGCHARWIMVGGDFRFGAARAGDVTSLAAAGRAHGFEVHALPTVMEAGERISSSAVRAALARGDFAHAHRLLGRAYAISGHVVHGLRLGRTLGFPTMNLRITHRPAVQGIFVVRVHGIGDMPLSGVASLGQRPTVDDSGRMLLEVHAFDFAQNVYGARVSVEFLKKLRDEERFDGLQELAAAIARDSREARAFVGARAASDTMATSATDRIS